LAFMMIACSLSCNAQTDIKASIASISTPMPDSSEEDKPRENLDYMVDTWSSAVTRDEVKKITSIMDFWSGDYLTKYKRDSFREIWVVNLKDYPDWDLDVDKIDPIYKAKSPTIEFTQEQLDLVAKAEYSDHLRFSAIFNRTTVETGKMEENVLISQSMSLVPDVQASYKGGFDALLNYLKKASKDHVKHVKRDNVGRCRIFFTVTEKGFVRDAKMIESSNYLDVDKAMIRIVKDMPRKWKPARDENGVKVEQEFVFTFGRAGC
ncbi:MAG: energy transducer TonB, partial [Saprospiraceae bacterium]|nr:energy transducer TonB [Saprospiraceae bacterium]